MIDTPAKIIVCASMADFAHVGARWIAACAKRAAADRGVFTLGLSGGSTPLMIFADLAEPACQASMPWALTRVFWCDERCVPPDDPMSNFGAARRALLSRLAPPPAQVNRMEAETADHEAAAIRYAARLPERLDLLVLGMGEDGHTCSLFPHSPLLHEREHRVALVTESPKPPSCRLTITPPVLETARCLLMLVTGKSKARAVADALTTPRPIDTLPARLAHRGAWLLDAEAASELPAGMCEG